MSKQLKTKTNTSQKLEKLKNMKKKLNTCHNSQMNNVKV